MGMDPRALATMDIGPSLNHARSALQAEDYFSGASRFTPAMRPRSPYPGMGEYEQEGQYPGGGIHGAAEMSPERLAYKVYMWVASLKCDSEC